MASYMAGLFCKILRAQKTRGELPIATRNFGENDGQKVWRITPGNRGASTYALRDHGGGHIYAPIDTQVYL